MKLIHTILFCLCSLGIVSSQNQAQVNYSTLLQALKKDIHNGQHRTLRDVISLMNHKEFGSQARTVLKNHTFFTKNEINVSSAKKADMMAFYYENVSKFTYSEVLNAFYITPIEERDISFELQQRKEPKGGQANGKLRRFLTELNERLEAKKYDKAEKIILEITDLKVGDQEVFMNILRDPRLLNTPEPLRQNIYQSLLKALETYPDLEVIEIALQMVEGDFLEEDFVISFLTQITNNTPPKHSNYESDVEYFVALIDSLSSYEEIRSHGYERLFNSRINFFQFPVDYYGKILALSDDYPIVKENIINDLKQAQHPRAFFYIASDLYRNWKEDPNYLADFHLNMIQSMTNVNIGVKNKRNSTTFNPLEDEVTMENYFLYWAAHYNDYEWDDNRMIFTNKLETIAKTQNYERLFRRLNSRNDTIALESFVRLTEGEYLEIKSLAKKYRQLLRNQNNSLPSLKYKYLEQLSLLTEYCRQNNISYKIRPSLARKLSKLLAVESPMERFAIENSIIEQMKLEDITAFEYWACLKEGSKNIAFSAGRILDWTYSKNWDKILNQKDQLRLFLKKSYLFENIGVSGICNAYLNKFDAKDHSQQQLLEGIGKIESDEDILNQISLLLTSDAEEDYMTYSIDDFLIDPLSFNRRDLKVLPTPSVTDVRKIVNVIKQEEEPEVIKKLFKYMWQHPNIEFIPFLFELIDDERVITKNSNVSVTVADNIIPIVENVYNHSFDNVSPKRPFATKEWRELWKNDGPAYDRWEQKFFEAKLDSLQYLKKLKIETLNELTESSLFSDKYKPSILGNLKKVKPIRNIRRLSVDPKLSVTEDLKYFENFFFSYKELDDIPKLFNITEENIDQMLSFIERKSASFEVSEKGSLYNNLFRASWLSRYINQGKLELSSAKIIEEALEEYLNESEFLSEFEEQMTQLNIAQLQFMGKEIQDKIDATIALDVDNSSKAKILKSIIATISYEEIRLVVNRFDEMSNILGEKTYQFLSQDFGIPVFSFSTMKEQEQFIRNHNKLSEFDFYALYLKRFGLDLFLRKNQLDYTKIYNILRFDNVSPFVGETGGKRDWYIYGIIKLLELQHDTRLGFHEKLNESQTFYSFSSTKRAQAWLQYLEEQHLVDPLQLFPSSFNFVRGE